jgi:flagellar biosynthetic protein FlhB
VDVPLQRFLLKQRLKMSHQEIKEEMRSSKATRRSRAACAQRMREAAQRRMLAAVPRPTWW